MTTAMSELWEQVGAFTRGRGFVDRSADRKLAVRGADAREWLGDLVTADVATLEPGTSRRSLLLTPTGRIRADLLIARCDDGSFLVMQTMDQPEPAVDLLTPYVLSSDVELEDVSAQRAALLLTVRNEIVTAPRPELSAVEHDLLDRGYLRIGEQAHEAWRVGHGDARMGVDFDAGALPAEAGLEHTIDFGKGCFLGQESVAKVRNLGHPPTVLRHGWTRADAQVGAPVHVAGDEVGSITSAAPRRGGGVALIARVTWDAAEQDLTAGGSALIPAAD
jgi:tRNA-modifying protein YgfZ